MDGISQSYISIAHQLKSLTRYSSAIVSIYKIRKGAPRADVFLKFCVITKSLPPDVRL